MRSFVLLDSEISLKVSIECDNVNIQYLGGVVASGRYSDWEIIEIDASVKSICCCLSCNK